jgi:HAD superfamily hydrolase (TIGR01490 family)
MKPGIAFFDFDGTITKKDTLIEFIKYNNGNLRLWLGLLLNSHYLIGYKLKIISNQMAKEKILSWFYGGLEVSAFRKLCFLFAKERIPSLIRPAALEEIKKLQLKQFDIVVVSASPEDWLNIWAQEYQIKVIATRLLYDKDCFTGKIQGANCNGDEKVRRINEQFDLKLYKIIYAYGDTSGDKPMFTIATRFFMKPFRN